jgi:acetylornithine deacetylase/succinyl-diaminopimelate desuccinylase-like protein
MAGRGRFNALSGALPHRARASGALVAFLLAIVPWGAQAIWPFEPGDEETLGARSARVLSRAIAIPSVNPPGDEAELARYLVGIASEAGLEAGLVPVPDADAAPATGAEQPPEARRAVAWARLPGAGRGRPLVLLSHLDVVAANPAEWSVPPFEGRIQDGHVIGRGALDAKGVAVIQLMSLIEMAQRDAPPARDVIWLATPDEESGGLHGAGWLVEARPDLLHEAEYLLTEGGNVRVGEGANVWGVAVTEKSPCWLELSARGTPGHSSTPRADAAVPRLVAALDAVRRIETRVRVLPQVQRMFAGLAPIAAPEDRAGYRDLRAALEQDRRFRKRFLSSPTRNALVRNTISMTVLEGSSKTNVAPATARAELDARLLPGESCSDFASAIANVVADQGVRVEILLGFPSKVSPAETPLYRAIERVAARDDPGSLVVPRVTAGFTDAHWFRDRGIVAYGFVPRWLSADDTRGIHGPEERVSIANLERGVRTLIAILDALDAGA